MPTDRALTLCPLGFLELDPPHLIRLAAHSGFSAVVLRTKAAIAGGPEYAMGLKDALMRNTLAAIRETGVRVDCVEQIGLTGSLDIVSLRPMLEAATALGATRVICSGDDSNLEVVVDRFASLCDLARPMGLSVNLEFMAFREVKTLGEAVAVVTAANRQNGAVVVDALHLLRSDGTVEDVRRLRPGAIAELQLCDAPFSPPTDGDIASEARGGRLPPGEGGLPLRELLAALPASTHLSVEVPLADERSAWSAQQRATLLYQAAASLQSGTAIQWVF